MKVRFNKLTLNEKNVEIWATTADNITAATKIVKTLEAKGFTAEIEAKADAAGNFLWWAVSGSRQWRTIADLNASRAETLKAPCGSGCGFSY